MSPARILFVCTGNICRSPLAEAVARHALVAHFQVPDLRTVGLDTASAGTHALAGNPATFEMQTVAAEIGLDLSEHRATRVDADVLTNASLVYAMEIEHVDWLRSLLPDAPVGLLGSAAIDDPYGSNLLEYRRACRAVVAAVQMRVPEMIVLAG